MNTTNEITYFVLVEKRAVDVWRYLTKEKLLCGWFCDSTDFELSVGSQVRFSGKSIPFGPGSGKIMAIESGNRLQFSYSLKDSESIIAFTLEEHVGMTRLIVSHSNFGGLSPHLLKESWKYLLAQLKHHCEYGSLSFRMDFSNMPENKIVQKLTVAASVDQAFAALVAPEKLDLWFSEGATVDLKKGGSIDYGWGTKPAEISEFIPDSVLETVWEDGTVLRWTVEKEEAKTVITLVHSGFIDEESLKPNFFGWAVFLSHLAICLRNDKNVDEWGSKF